MRNLILIAITALLFSTGCKTRQTKLKVFDSTGVSKQNTKEAVTETTIDKTKTNEVSVTKKTDSTVTTTVITPADGKTIKVGTDGTFTGEAKSINTTTKKAINESTEKRKDTYNDIVKTFKKEVTITTYQTVTVHKKDKETEAKPDYSFIWWIGGGLLILFGVYLVLKKFKVV